MKELHDWFQKNQREFPWRRDKSPYRVWISEVMLQQTRATVVVEYFERWMRLFPDIQSLAAAPIEKIIKAWEGLGYYSRARNLHTAAQQIIEKFEGKLPEDRKELEGLKGLGPYTIGAILAFGFRKRAAAVDGNVARVLSRYLLIEENICKQRVRRKIEQEAEKLLDEKEPWVTAEALIELGATICLPQRPKCSDCPLQENCKAYEQKKVAILPIKNGMEKAIELKRLVCLIELDGKVLLRKGEKGRVMADLYEFPYFEMGSERWTQRKVVQKIKEKLGLEAEIIGSLPETIHTFTRYKAHLFPLWCQSFFEKKVAGYEWVSKLDLSHLPFSSGHRKILQIAFLRNMCSS